MKVKVFDVVKLNNGAIATVIDENKEIYRGQITNADGQITEVRDFKISDVTEIIYTRPNLWWILGMLQYYIAVKNGVKVRSCVKSYNITQQKRIDIFRNLC